MSRPRTRRRVVYNPWRVFSPAGLPGTWVAGSAFSAWEGTCARSPLGPGGAPRRARACAPEQRSGVLSAAKPPRVSAARLPEWQLLVHTSKFQPYFPFAAAGLSPHSASTRNSGPPVAAAAAREPRPVRSRGLPRRPCPREAPRAAPRGPAVPAGAPASHRCRRRVPVRLLRAAQRPGGLRPSPPGPAAGAPGRVGPRVPRPPRWCGPKRGKTKTGRRGR